MLPLGFHKRAEPAARAVVAAKAQGKGWAYDKVLWENNKALEDADLEKYAGLAGLDVAQWKKDWNSPRVAAHVQHQAYLAGALGIRGTPNFFVNGENVRGAKPFEGFKQVIDRKLAEAKKFEAEGIALDKLHARATATAVGGAYKRYIIDGEKPPKPKPKAAQAPKAPLDKKQNTIAIGDSPRIGKGDAVVIAEYSDFQ